MKINDFICQFPTAFGSRRVGICRARVFVSVTGEVVAILTDLGRLGTGASVTNFVESIRRTMVARGFIGEQVQIIEHYESGPSSHASFDRVLFDGDGELLTINGISSAWQRMTIEEVFLLTGCDSGEFESKTRNNERLYKELERIRNEIDPFIDSPYPESPDVINRRAEIREKMISKEELSTLVDSGAIEQKIQSLLKRDLSLFAEMYARPVDDYICFAEYPVADGAVDFVVFSGISRMEVTLIEIKGADFDLVNQNSYEKFSAKIETAADQIRRRLGYVYRDYNEFKRSAHRIRKVAESGKPIHNALVGPLGKLQVDPNKDLTIHGVVIGGRSRNDLKESRKRHEYEFTTSPPIKIESWDSWLRKLSRE